MVAPLKPLELTAAQIIGILIEAHNLKDGRWTPDTNRNYAVLSTSCQTNI